MGLLEDLDSIPEKILKLHEVLARNNGEMSEKYFDTASKYMFKVMSMLSVLAVPISDSVSSNEVVLEVVNLRKWMNVVSRIQGSLSAYFALVKYVEKKTEMQLKVLKADFLREHPDVQKEKGIQARKALAEALAYEKIGNSENINVLVDLVLSGKELADNKMLLLIGVSRDLQLKMKADPDRCWSGVGEGLLST